MSFRDRLLQLLHEHEELATQHESLLQVMRKFSNPGMKHAHALSAEPVQINLCRHQEAAADNHHLFCISNEGDGVSELEDKDVGLPKTPEASPSVMTQAVDSAGGGLASLSWADTSTNPIREARRSDILASERRRKRLKHVFEVSESVEEEEKNDQAVKDHKKELGFSERLRQMDRQQLEIFLDSCIGLVIVVNALFIGARMDYDHDVGVGPWQLMDTAFTGIFIFELSLKVFLHGLGQHFCGTDKIANIFDACLIFADALQLLFSYLRLRGKDQEAGIPDASVFRVIRLIRLTRLFRVFRTEAFKDLVVLLQGMMSGLLTLFWAIVVFGLMVYVMSLVCRSSFGYPSVENVTPYFSTVPRSMFTVFRCSFGDCSSQFGTPIPEHISSHYGAVYGALYCAFDFLVVIGMFNVISAIYVDATVASTTQLALKKSSSRLNDDRRWATNLTSIIKKLLYASGEDQGLPMQRLSTVVDKVALIEFTREAIDDVVQEDHKVREALLALDIDILDHKHLSDILDPDHTGTVTVLDLLNGLQRLRGQPRRSDVITVDLMLRCLQERIDETHARLVTVQDKIFTLVQDQTFALQQHLSKDMKLSI